MTGSCGYVPYEEPTSCGLATLQGRFSWFARGITSSVEIKHTWRFSDLPMTYGQDDKNTWDLTEVQAEALLQVLIAWDKTENNGRNTKRALEDKP